MTFSQIQKAERASRARAVLMAIAAVTLIVQMLLGVGDEAGSARPFLRHLTWGVMILLWLMILFTGGGLRLSRDLRSVMNDEVSLANRGRALQAAFWAAMAIGCGLYFASLAWDVSVREALRILVNGAIAVALATYGWAELR